MSADCDKTRERLTAYLDGDLGADSGTVVRGHLRTCDGCREVAEAEAKLRDGLRALPTVDPPASMWAGVQARLAANEVEEAARPAWRRAVNKVLAWGGSATSGVLSPRMLAGGLAAAAVATVIVWRLRAPESSTTRVVSVPSPTVASSHETTPDVAPIRHVPLAPDGTDVTADLASEGARRSGTYATTAEELLTLVDEVKSEWSDAERRTFETEVKRLEGVANAASDERARQRALRSLIKYVQRALVRDDVALANGGAP